MGRKMTREFVDHWEMWSTTCPTARNKFWRWHS
jgi:hypothetical protein